MADAGRLLAPILALHDRIRDAVVEAGERQETAALAAVPTVATTAKGRRRAWMSRATVARSAVGRMRYSPSTSTRRIDFSPRPSRTIASSMARSACSET